MLGIDTSNYTTSVALVQGSEGRNVSCLLNVKAGELGLRQSEALFQHIKNLPQLLDQLADEEEDLIYEIQAVGASTQPRPVEESYMPCFLAGASQGASLASVLGVPFYRWSHQEGHFAAAAWSVKRMDLLEAPFLAWHLSGGTTELLRVEPLGNGLQAEIVGGTSDISAGQLIDRTGVYLGLRFPAGEALDELSRRGEPVEAFPVKQKDLKFSLSGVENKVKEMAERGEPPEAIASFVIETVASVVHRVTVEAQNQWPGLPVLCSGGVASNRRLRFRLVEYCQAVFGMSEFSSDNAMGIAALTERALERGKLL